MTFEPGPETRSHFRWPAPSAVVRCDRVLPERAADRLRALRQHFHDLHALTVPFEDRRVASNAKIAAAQRLKRLLDHQHDGGFHLSEDDPRVIQQQRLLDGLSVDLAAQRAQ